MPENPNIPVVSSLDELLEEAKHDAIIGAFIIDGLIAHCDDEDALNRFLIALLMNLAINKLMCPFCFIEKLTDITHEAFEKIETKDGDHDVVLKNADELSDAIKGDEVSH